MLVSAPGSPVELMRSLERLGVLPKLNRPGAVEVEAIEGAGRVDLAVRFLVYQYCISCVSHFPHTGCRIQA